MIYVLDSILKRVLDRREFAQLAGVMGLSVLALGLVGCEGGGSGHGDNSSANPITSEGSLAQTSQASDEQRERVIFAFDTVVTLKASCTEDMLDALQSRCEYFESIFSRTIETSDIGRINAAQGASVRVAPETADIITKALGYCEESQGRFDITIGAVSTLWDFKTGIVPNDVDIKEAVKHVDYHNVQVNDTTVMLKDPQAKLDLGGIAKGYIADDLCDMMASAGVTSGFVNLGGNVKTVGTRPDGNPWHVGIQDPNDEAQAIIATVNSTDSSAVTSGLYERRFEKNGKSYWHILDSKTGYPIKTDLISATIFSKASLDGDGYTKPLFMMGFNAALKWLEAKEGIEGLIEDTGGNIAQTSGCDARLTK